MHIVNIFKLELIINWTIEAVSVKIDTECEIWEWTANAHLSIYGGFFDLIFRLGILPSFETKNDPFLRSFTKQSGVIKTVIMVATDSGKEVSKT